MILAVDTETLGLDRFHGCLSYLVTTCDSKNQHRVWEWTVNPKTRKVLIDDREVLEIQALLDSADKLVFHNAKFDIKMLAAIGIKVDHLWSRIEDTLFIAHMLASQADHDLTSTVKLYLKGPDGKGRDISPFETKMEKCVQEARRWCRSHLKDWKLASEGIEDNDGSQLMPSTKGSNDKTGRAWMADTWLPKAVALHEGPAWVKGHQNEEWLTCTDDYADIDSSCLIPLYDVMMKEVRRRKLEKIYRERLRILPPIHRMEHYGTTYKLDTHIEMKREFTEKVQELEAVLYGIAECYDNYQLELPKRGRNKSLDTFVFDVLKLPILEWSTPTKGKVYTQDKPFIPKPVFDEDIKEEYEATLPAHSMELSFIRALNQKSEYDTALGYMAAYERFCIKDKSHVLKTPLNCGCTKGTDEKCPVCEWGASVCSICGKAEVELDEPCIGGKYAILHPNLNPTGTVGLRFSHTNPNSANVSKHKKTNLRKCFGPRDNRIWYSLDYTNIELVIPAEEVGETELVELFRYPDRAPFYGSFHMVMFSALWPDLWADALKRFGPEGAAKFCKSEYEDEEYQWTKNFDFACVPMDTLALTRKGWKTYEQLQVGDEVLGYEEGKLKWTPVLDKVYYELADLVQIHNKYFSATVTPNHRWVSSHRNSSRVRIEQFVETRNITTEHTLILSAPVEDITTLNITCDEAALIGFAYGDGSINRSVKGYGTARGDGTKVGFDVRLYQSKPKGIAYINDLLCRLKFSYNTYGRKIDSLVIYVLNPKFCRDIWQRAGLWDKQDFEDFVLKLGPEQRKSFLDAVFMAEGNWSGRSSDIRVISQNAGSFCDGINLCIFLTGHYPTGCRIGDKHSPGAKCCRLLEGKPFVTGQRLKVTPIEGKQPVWCIKTACDSWVMRQANRIMLTGNTQYGCMEKKANVTAHHPKAFKMKAERCPKIDALAKKLIKEAEKNNCVTTIPDRTVDPERGFPIMSKRSHWGKVEPTTPLCYHVSSTAAQVLNKAMVLCDEKLIEWRIDGFDAHMILTIHDELVFDFPLLPHPIQKIISGGQTGADQGGLRAAKSYGIETGGWSVKGWKTESGPNLTLREFGLVETDTNDYPTRTRKNVEDSDGTIRIAADFGSAGERCTMNAIRNNSKPSIDISLNKPTDVGVVAEWVKKNGVRVLNVAGNCESTHPGVGKFAEEYIRKLLVVLDPCNERANELRSIMESASNGIGIPIRVSVERHCLDWATGEVVPRSK